MSEQVDLYGMREALRLRLLAQDWNQWRINNALRQMDAMQDKAIAYVWGHEDGGGVKITHVYGRKIIDVSWEFGHMIAIMVAASYLGDSTMPHAPNLRHSFAAFRASRDLRDYVHEPTTERN